MDKKKYNEYMRKYHIKRYHDMRSNIIESMGGKCKKCGSTTNLHIDHINHRSKKLEIAKAILSVSKIELEKELKKCQLLCKTCHTSKSIKELGNKEAKGTHGTLSSYRYCKCEKCREAIRKWTRAYRKKRRCVRRGYGPAL